MLSRSTHGPRAPVRASAISAACALVFGVVSGMAVAPAVASDLSRFLEGWEHAASNGKTSHIVDIDNDSLLLNRDDGFYSSGLRYTRQHELRQGSETVHYGWRIGQELYTASDIKLGAEQIGANDHPYAGWLYAGVYKQTAQADGTSWRWGLDLGCLGPCAGGEWTQSTLHRILDQPLPEGWSTQVGNEVGLVLHAERAFAAWHWTPGISLTLAVNGRLGNIFTDAGGALLLRAQLGETAKSQSSSYGFLRVEGRAVGYNATLQGGYFSGNSSHTVEPRRLVGEAEAGVAWQLSPFVIRISILRRSNPIQGLTDTQGSQNIGRLQVSYSP